LFFRCVECNKQFAAGLAAPGPYLIEAVL